MLPISLVILSILAFANATPTFLVEEIHVNKIPYIEEYSNPQLFADVPADAKLTTLQLVEKYGFNGELHKVVTSDGIILELHRITGRTNTSKKQKPVAFVMHGLLASSAVWVLSGPEKGLGFILADAGYDVWMGNARGTVYSRKHLPSPAPEEDYWDFSWHEIGMHDLPAMIDYTLNVTGREKLFYLGHSQGTTSFFVMASMKPEYQNKIQAMFAMAPVAYCSRASSPILKFLATFANSINFISKLIGKYEFEPTSEGMKKFQSLICAEDAITQPLCSNVLFLIAGYDEDQFNKTLLPIILGHVPAGASTKQFMHYAQIINSGEFCQYDYGWIGNWNKYGSLWPPKYNLAKILVPVSLHYGENDWLANVEDVRQLYDELGKPFGKFPVPFRDFNHLDFMWAKDVKELLYDKILSLMTRFQ